MKRLLFAISTLGLLTAAPLAQAYDRDLGGRDWRDRDRGDWDHHGDWGRRGDWEHRGERHHGGSRMVSETTRTFTEADGDRVVLTRRVFIEPDGDRVVRESRRVIDRD